MDRKYKMMLGEYSARQPYAPCLAFRWPSLPRYLAVHHSCVRLVFRGLGSHDADVRSESRIAEFADEFGLTEITYGSFRKFNGFKSE